MHDARVIDAMLDPKTVAYFMRGSFAHASEPAAPQAPLVLVPSDFLLPGGRRQ